MIRTTEKNEEKLLVIGLRKIGKSFQEIKEILGYSISKSTLSTWCKNIQLPIDYLKKLAIQNKAHLI